MPNTNRDKGIRAERGVAAYLRAAGISNAERRVVTGWQRTDRGDPDLGDLKGIPGLCVQVKDVVKSHPGGLSGKALADIMAQTESQRLSSGACIGLLVEKRAHYASPGFWWAHLPANMFVALVDGQDPWSGHRAQSIFIVRTELRNLTSHLVRFSGLCPTGANM